MRLRADVTAPAAARAHLHGVFARTEVPEGVRDELVLIASELVTNAVQSGSTTVSIDLEVGPETLLLTVDDDGKGWPVVTEAYVWDTAGRGLAIVDHLADHWEVTRHDLGKRVTVAKRLVERGHHPG